MKSIIIIGDGMSDLPVAKLGGKTPLMVAHKPHIDRVAREGRMGRLRTIGETGPADSAVANLAVLGYDASASSQGRAVLEAASMGVEIVDGDVALRCNLACVEGPVGRPAHQEPLGGSHLDRGGDGAHPRARRGTGWRARPDAGPLSPGGELPAPDGPARAAGPRPRWSARRRTTMSAGAWRTCCRRRARWRAKIRRGPP